MSEPVLDQVRQIAADLFNVPLDSINAASGPGTVEDWDSVQHVNLVISLESHFDVQFVPEDVDRMSSIGAISSLIEERIAR